MHKKKEKRKLLIIIYIIFTLCFSFYPIIFNETTVRAATFGQTGTGGGTPRSVGGAIEGSVFTCPVDCTATGISIYIRSRDQANDWFCQIWEGDGSSVVAYTNERSIGPEASYGWEDFTFASNPTLSGSTDYFITAAGDHNDCLIYREVGDNDNAYYYNYGYNYPTLPSSHPMNNAPTRGDYAIYVTYETGWINTAPTIEQEYPVNQSTGISLTPELSVRVNDSDGNNSKVYWYTNSTGGSQWTLLQTNTTVLNETVRLMTFSNASSYSTKYFWRVSANDSNDNTTKTFQFTTIPDPAGPWSNSPPYFSAESPTNESSNRPRWPILEITVTDDDGNNSEVDFYYLDGAAWYKLQHNSTVLNETVRFMNLTNASSYSTTYYWKVTANDTHDNSSEVNHFTTESAPEADDDYYVSNSGSDSNNGLFPTQGAGSDGPWATVGKVNTEMNGGDISVGDDVYFERGDSWSGTQLILRQHGENGNPLRIGAYGSGAKPYLTTSNLDIIVPHSSLSGDGYITIQDLNLSYSGSGDGIGWTGMTSYFTNLKIINCTMIDCYYGVILRGVNGFVIRDCTINNKGGGMSAISINGDSSLHIKNGRVWNNTLKNAPKDGVNIHYRNVDTSYVGENLWVYNNTISGFTEAGIDMAPGRSSLIGGYYIANNRITNCVQAGIAGGHGTINAVYENNDIEGCNHAFIFTDDENTIVRNNTIEDWSTNLYAFNIYSVAAGYPTQNIMIYNNNLIADTSGAHIRFSLGAGDWVDNLDFKNNILYSKQSSSPTLFLNCVPSLTSRGTYWTNNTWWRGDGLGGRHWDVGSSSITYPFWIARSDVWIDYVENPDFNDPGNRDYTLQSNSPCIDAGTWLTMVSGSSNGQWVAVNEPGYFFDGYGITGLDGDNIFIGNTENLEVIDVNYDNLSIKVNRSVSASQGEDVSLSYYQGETIDIGAFEFIDNNAPTVTGEIPADTDTGISLSPKCNVTANDGDGDTLTITWASNYTGAWLNYQTNNSVTANTSVSWIFSGATEYSTKYFWKVYVFDDTQNISETYSFTTVVNNSPVITGEIPADTATGISLSPICNVTVTDAEDSITVTWASNYTGAWLNYQTNSSLASGSIPTWILTGAIQYGTKYYWRVYANDTHVNISETYSFTTTGNTSSVITGEIPANTSGGISLMPLCNVTVTDAEDSMNVYFYNSTDGSTYTLQQTNSSVASGTNVTWNYTQATLYDTTYYWKVSVNDSINNVTEQYQFTTRIITNNASTISGVNPTNGSLNNEQITTVNITANDIDGDNLDIYWYEDRTGDWVLQQTNSTVAAGSNVQWIYSNTSGVDRYNYLVCIWDGTQWTNESFWFNTSFRIFDILYVDNFVKYANNPILQGTEEWEEFGIREFDFLTNTTGFLLKENGVYPILYTGRNETTLPYRKDTAIGRATTSDLINYTKEVTNPVIRNTTTGSVTHEEYALTKAFIKNGTGDYFTFYSSDIGKNLTKVLSADGVTWTTNYTVYDPTTNATNPSHISASDVKQIDGKFYCVYEAKDDISSDWGIYLLSSTDYGESWTPENGGYPLYTGTQAWDNTEVKNPEIFKLATEEYIIVYSGRDILTNEFDIGILLSRNISSGYVPWGNNPILTNSSSGWDDERIEAGTFVANDIGKRILRMWYVGTPTTDYVQDAAIGYATCVDPYYPHPYQSNPNPANGSNDTIVNPTVYIDVIDNQGDQMTLQFRTNATGPWTTISTNNNVNNGTYNTPTTNMNSYNTTYWWAVNLTNNSGFYENITYHFTTENASNESLIVITNASTGVTNINATLHGFLQEDSSQSCIVGFEYGTTISYGTTVYLNYTEGNYTGTHWDTNTRDNEMGITTDDSFIWVVDQTAKEVYKYYMNGTYTTEHWDTSSQSSNPMDITTNGTFIWITDISDNVYKYYMNGTYTGETWSTTSQTSDPYGITTNGTFFWVADPNNDEVYKYEMDGTYTNDHWDTAASGNGDPRSISTNGNNIWIADKYDKEVYKYEMDGTFVTNWDTAASGAGNPRGIEANDTSVFVLDSSDDEVYIYYVGSYDRKNKGDTFTIGVNGLAPGEFYHYRAIAKNSTSTRNGSDLSFLTKPNASTTGYVNRTNVTDFNITWVKGIGANNTYIERNTVSTWSRGSGSLVYNGSGTNYLDDSTGGTPLSQDTNYNYRLWSYAYWPSTNKYSDTSLLISNTTYHVEPPYNGNSVYDYPLLNLTWSRSSNSNQELVIARNDSYATSWDQSGNWIRQNGTLTYFNITENQERYYTIFSYNTTDKIYSPTGLDISFFGNIIINVYNESNPAQNVTNWNIHIKNYDGSQTYTAYNKNNTLAIDIDTIPNGTDIIIMVWATGYKERIKTVDLLQNFFYSIKFYLPPIETATEGEDEEQTLRAYTNSISVTNPSVDTEINLTYLLENIIDVQIYNDTLYVTYGGWYDVPEDLYSYNATQVVINKTVLDDNTSMARASYYYWHSQPDPIPTPIYYIRIVETYETSSGIFERPVENAKVTFQKYINTTDQYENISSLLTDANGFVNLYLIPSDLYQVVITKTGYEKKISNYQPPPPNEFGQTTEKTFKIEQTEDADQQIQDILMDVLTLSPYNSTVMWIYYMNLNEDNSHVNLSVYDYIGDILLNTYNVSTNPNNISIYFNFSSYSLSGDILRVTASAERINGTIYTHVKYFDVKEARRLGAATYAPIVAMLSVGICLFGLTIAHPKRVLGFVGIITMVIAIAITVFVEQVWYLHLLQAMELICLIVIVLTFREEGVHAI